MNRKYRNPPIVEVLCEFQFVPHQPWDLTIPGLIYEKIKKEFPNREQQIGVGVQFKPTEEGFEHKVEPAPPRIQFHREDKTALIQVAPDLLVINQLIPYSTWAKFKPIVLRALKTYKEIATPKGFKRIGLRYINKMNFKAESVNLSEYVKFYPSIPEDLPCSRTSFILRFISRIEIPYMDNRDRMLITVGSIPPQNQDTTSLVLDLDYIMYVPEAISMEVSEEWIEQAHSTIEETFESCITDKSRILFKEVK